MNRGITPLYFAMCALSILYGCATPQSAGLGPSKSEFDSQWVEMPAGIVTGERGGGPVLMLTLKNKTDRTVWVKVEFTAPNPSHNCATAKELSPKGSASFSCPQKEIVADVPYPVSVATFSDEALTQNLETKQTKMQFGAQEVAAMMAWMTPPTLPATFSGIWYRTDEAQSLLAYKEKGTLIVSADKLQFTHPNGNVEVFIASIKKVIAKKKMGWDLANDWVVVEYRAEDKDAIIAFKSAPFSRKPSDVEIYSAISWAHGKK